MWFGAKLEWHPFDFNVFTADCFFKRELRQVAKRSDVVRIDLDLQSHGLASTWMRWPFWLPDDFILSRKAGVPSTEYTVRRGISMGEPVQLAVIKIQSF